jgi:hypothetical protein
MNSWMEIALILFIFFMGVVVGAAGITWWLSI